MNECGEQVHHTYCKCQKYTAYLKYIHYKTLLLVGLYNDTTFMAVWIKSMPSSLCLAIMCLYLSYELLCSFQGPMRRLVLHLWQIYCTEFYKVVIVFDIKEFHFICPWTLSSSSVIPLNTNLAIGYVLVNTHQTNPLWSRAFAGFGRLGKFVSVDKRKSKMHWWVYALLFVMFVTGYVPLANVN